MGFPGSKSGPGMVVIRALQCGLSKSCSKLKAFTESHFNHLLQFDLDSKESVKADEDV